MSWLIKTTTANYESFSGNTHFGFIFHSDDCDFKQNTSGNDLGWYGSWDSNQIKGQQIQWRSGQISGKMKLSKKSNISNWQLHCLNLKHFTELTVIPLPWLNPPTAQHRAVQLRTPHSSIEAGARGGHSNKKCLFTQYNS